MEINARIIIDLYKKRIADLEHENILLQAQIIQMQEVIEEKDIKKK